MMASLDALFSLWQRKEEFGATTGATTNGHFNALPLSILE
jgi:hypothetical protein